MILFSDSDETDTVVRMLSFLPYCSGSGLGSVGQNLVGLFGIEMFLISSVCLCSVYKSFFLFIIKSYRGEPVQVIV